MILSSQERYARARALLSKLKRIDALRAELLSFMRDLRMRMRDLEALDGAKVHIWVRNCHDSAGEWLGAGFRLLCALGDETLSPAELAEVIKLEDQRRGEFRMGLVHLDREKAAWLRRSRKARITTMPARCHPIIRRVLREWAQWRKLEKAEARQERAVAGMQQ